MDSQDIFLNKLKNTFDSNFIENSLEKVGCQETVWGNDITILKEMRNLVCSAV